MHAHGDTIWTVMLPKLFSSASASWPYPTASVPVLPMAVPPPMVVAAVTVFWK